MDVSRREREKTINAVNEEFNQSKHIMSHVLQIALLNTWDFTILCAVV